MRNSLLLPLSLAAAVLALGIGAEAAQPVFFAAEVNRTFASPFFTAACGFEVLITEVGTVKATVFRDADGSIVREFDTQPGFVITYSSPESGKELTFPFATVFRYDFPSGATAGAPAIVTASGLMDKVPGVSADAGRIIFGSATVLFVDASGVPIVDFGAPSAFVGRVNDSSTLIEAGCAALAR